MTTTTKITKLTPEQALALALHYEEWLAVGTCTDRADRPRAEAAITEMYRRIGKEAPAFFWFSSPAMALLGGHALRTLTANRGDLLPQVKLGRALRRVAQPQVQLRVEVEGARGRRSAR